MRLGHQFDRSQFPRVADPGVKNVYNHLITYTTKALKDIRTVIPQSFYCNSCFNIITGARHKCQDYDDYDFCQGCLILAPMRHPSGHKFKAIEKSEESMDSRDTIQARYAQQERDNVLSNMRVRMANAQIARSAAQVEFLGRIGTGVCYSCGYQPCRCHNNFM
jgi:hypothetical protein